MSIEQSNSTYLIKCRCGNELEVRFADKKEFAQCFKCGKIYPNDRKLYDGKTGKKL
jgi:hypothetical protein